MSTKLGIAFVVAAGLLISIAAPRAQAGDAVYIESTARPQSSRILATTGTVLGYQLLAAKHIVSARLTILDAFTHQKERFVITEHATLNGIPLKCLWAPLGPFPTDYAPFVTDEQLTADEAHFCQKLPAPIIVGETHVILLYWDRIRGEGDRLTQSISNYPYTDAIWTIP